LNDPSLRIRSFIISSDSLSICYSKEVEEYLPQSFIGVDRNLTNVTTGNVECVVQYSVSKLVDIAENTGSIVRSFRRNDVRIRKKIYAKYGRRRKDRTHQLLHKSPKIVVRHAKEKKAAIVFEDISYIRQLYLGGNGQGRSQRARMNSWLFHEPERQFAYKAALEGISCNSTIWKRN
jgi:IS605 OrfB family transposase